MTVSFLCATSRHTDNDDGARWGVKRGRSAAQASTHCQRSISAPPARQCDAAPTRACDIDGGRRAKKASE